MDAHRFPQHFVNMEREVGLGPAAIVSSVRGTDASVLRPLDANRSIRQHYPLVGQYQYLLLSFSLFFLTLHSFY